MRVQQNSFYKGWIIVILTILQRMQIILIFGKNGLTSFLAYLNHQRQKISNGR